MARQLIMTAITHRSFLVCSKARKSRPPQPHAARAVSGAGRDMSLSLLHLFEGKERRKWTLKVRYNLQLAARQRGRGQKRMVHPRILFEPVLGHAGWMKG